MNDTELTADERECLRLWFRQALAQAEIEDAKRSLLAEHSTTPVSHTRYAARRARRSTLTPLVKQLV